MLLQTTDSDNDGVTDAKDKCTDTLPGMPVDATGCDRDSDNDGVADQFDLCPDSSEGSTVDRLGCETKANIVLADITFALGTANLTDSARENLNTIARVLAQFDDIKLEVAGYTDSIGNRDRNQQLSEKRATAVMNYLITQGTAADKLTAKGYGQDDPIADNSTAEGQAKNRRVELHRR